MDSKTNPLPDKATWEAGRDVAAAMFRAVADQFEADCGAGMYIEGENRYRQIGAIKTLPYPDGVQDLVCRRFVEKLIDEPSLVPGFSAVMTAMLFEKIEGAVDVDLDYYGTVSYEQWIEVPEDEDGVRATAMDKMTASELVWGDDFSAPSTLIELAGSLFCDAKSNYPSMTLSIRGLAQFAESVAKQAECFDSLDICSEPRCEAYASLLNLISLVESVEIHGHVPAVYSGLQLLQIAKAQMAARLPMQSAPATPAASDQGRAPGSFEAELVAVAAATI